MGIEWKNVRQYLEGGMEGDAAGAKERVRDLVECLELLEQTIIDADRNDQNHPVFRMIHKATSGLLQIQELLSHFREAPDKGTYDSVHGSGGVAEKLSISPAAVLLRVQTVGLSIPDFLEPNASLSSLILKGESTYHSCFSKIRASRGNMFILLARTGH